MVVALRVNPDAAMARIIAPSRRAQGYALAAKTRNVKSRRRNRGPPAFAVQEAPPGGANALRIVGGQWCGRRIHFPPMPALRPTPDRVRETLFNWLQGTIGGARCLDLFAGSGALGLEALSRGAAEVVFVERDPAVAAALAANLALLERPAIATSVPAVAAPAGATAPGAGSAARGRVLAADAFGFLAGTPRPFDVVFLDPPYGQGRLPELCRLLESRGWLAARALVYIESAAREGQPALPPSWSPWRQLRAGAVSAGLARRAESP
jgi:16S rRNA (guanine966-N2)-methyltransferase